MDPRHPEQAVTRLKELIKQYDGIEEKIKEATVSSQLGQLEREGGLVVQEMCLVAPRIHEAMIQASRERRHELTIGVVEKPVEKSLHRADVVFDIENPYGEIEAHDAKPEEYIEKPKKKRKYTRKKKVEE